MENKSIIINKLKELLVSKVKFAILFGSILKDSFNNESDIDIAIYLEGKYNQSDEIFNIKSDFYENINFEVDLIVLNTSDIIITMQAIANGELIINNDNRFFVEFKARKISEYIDFKMSRKIIEDNLLRGSINA